MAFLGRLTIAVGAVNDNSNQENDNETLEKQNIRIKVMHEVI